MRRAILVTIDGWGTNLVGSYGNALCETPALDRFAARSIVYDRFSTSAAQLDSVLESIVSGQHPCQRPLTGQRALTEFLQTLGKQSVFMTDDPSVAELAWVQSFNEVYCFDPTSSVPLDSTILAADGVETRLAIFIEAALGELARYCEQPDGLPDWTWLHLSGLTRTWDAPYEYRLQLCDDEDDPEPPRENTPARFKVDRQTDPDRIFGAACGAAAQGMIIDQVWSWIDAFLDQVLERGSGLVVMAGVRGYPLGEHQSVGLDSDDLFSEYVHTPLMIQPGQPAIGARDDSLVQPMSIWATIATWLVVEPGQQGRLHDELERRPLANNLLASHSDDCDRSSTPLPACLIASQKSFSLQVPRWSAVWRSSEDSSATPHPERLALYLSPDDRWQQNDVANRAAEIAEAMIETRSAWLKWFAEGCPPTGRPGLPDCLKRSV